MHKKYKYVIRCNYLLKFDIIIIIQLEFKKEWQVLIPMKYTLKIC